MKKVLIFVMTLMAVSNVFASESSGNPDVEARQGTRHEMVQLNLTDAQKTQMKALREKHMAERQVMQERQKADIKAILTAEQWAKFEKMRPGRPGMEGGMNRGAGNEGGKMRGKGMKGVRDNMNMDHEKPEQVQQK